MPLLADPAHDADGEVRIWNPLDPTAWYYGRQSRKLNQSLAGLSAYSLVFLLAFLVLTQIGGCQEIYEMPAGGRGYTRVPSLVGLWSTAPYLLNNTVGYYVQDPSVEGRMRAFEDGIGKMLWPGRREQDSVLGDKVPASVIVTSAQLLAEYLADGLDASRMRVPRGRCSFPLQCTQLELKSPRRMIRSPASLISLL